METRMFRSLLVATLAVGLALVTQAPDARAEDAPAPTKDQAQIPAGKYVLDPSHANVVFEVRHLGLSNYIGRFNTIDGWLNFDPASKTKGTGEITLATASIDTNHEVLEGHLKGPEWFDAATYPAITFKVTGIDQTGPSWGTLNGELTMHGVTKPLALTLIFNGGMVHPFTKKFVLGFDGSGKIKRSDWGVTKFIPMVGDDVTLHIRAEFIKAD